MQVAAVYPPQDLVQQALDHEARGRLPGGRLEHRVEVAAEVAVEGLKDEKEAVATAIDVQELRVCLGNGCVDGVWGQLPLQSVTKKSENVVPDFGIFPQRTP